MTEKQKTNDAAAMIVSESVANLGKCYRNNTGGTASLLEWERTLLECP